MIGYVAAVNDYATAIGRIEAALGISGDVPLEQTIEAVRVLVVQAKTDALEIQKAKDKVSAVFDLLSANGCDCDCGCDCEGHSPDCERCLACRIEGVIHG
jgi:hypothetical protein